MFERDFFSARYVSWITSSKPGRKNHEYDPVNSAGELQGSRSSEVNWSVDAISKLSLVRNGLICFKGNFRK